MAKEQRPAIGNLYSRLGINRRATDDQVRAAYYRLARVLHPDRKKGGKKDEEAFNSIVRAAAILRDPATRQLYDRGAIDENGVPARSGGRRRRWSSRELALACLTAAVTVLVSLAGLYSVNRSGLDLQPPDAHAGRSKKGPEIASAASPATPLTHPSEESGELRPAPHSDGSPAAILKTLQVQRSVYSPPSSPPIAGNQDEAISTITAAAADDGFNPVIQKNSIFLKKSAAAKRKSKTPSSSNILVFSPRQQEKLKLRSECSLTSAARNILAGILSR